MPPVAGLPAAAAAAADKNAIGIICPPPEVRNIVDKTVQNCRAGKPVPSGSAKTPRSKLRRNAGASNDGDEAPPQENLVDMNLVLICVNLMGCKFRRGDNVNHFFSRLKFLCGHMSNREQVEVFHICLGDEEFKECTNIKHTLTNLQEAEKWLRSTLDKLEHPTQAMFYLITEKQKEREGVTEFVARMEDRFKTKYPEDGELILVDLIWLGLKPEISMNFSVDVRPTTVKELEQIAVEIERRRPIPMPNAASKKKPGRHARR